MKHRLIVMLLVMFLGATSLAGPAISAPHPDTGLVFGTKAGKQATRDAKKQDAQQRKRDAEASKDGAKCQVNGTLPCNPTATLELRIDATDGGAYLCPRESTWSGFSPNTTYYWVVVADGVPTTSRGSATTLADGSHFIYFLALTFNGDDAKNENILIVYADAAFTTEVARSNMMVCSD